MILIGLAFANNLALALLLASQYAQSLIIMNGITLRQRLTPDRLQGRVNVTARMIAWGDQPFGAAIGGFVADRLSIGIPTCYSPPASPPAPCSPGSPHSEAPTKRRDRLVREAE